MVHEAIDEGRGRGGVGKHGRPVGEGKLVVTNLDDDDWLNFLGNKHMVTALLSRLRHQCTTIRIDGPSLREPQG